MKKVIMSLMGTAALIFGGCGGSLDGTNLGDASNNGTTTEDQVAGLVITGSGIIGDAADEAQADLNAQVTKAIADQIESEINAQLEDEEFQAELAAADDPELAKDVRVGLGIRGITVFIEDESVPFAGGEMLLNAEVGLKLKFRPGFRIDVVASGEMTSELVDVQREGYIEGFPYSLALNGTNKMSLDGMFSITIKNWKVSAMQANLASKIVASNVEAVGEIADKGVRGSVDMMDVGLTITNPDVLKRPGDFTIKCSGDIEARINDRAIALCSLAETCLSCK